MLGLELVVALGVAILACSLGAERLRIGAPLLLLAGGVVLGFVPAFRRVELPSEVVLLLFLPALLYWESLTTSLREIRSNLRGIVLSGTGLVLVTAAAVAFTAHALGMPWGPAWVLGAALAPTDATAVAALAGSLPHRTVTVLRAESLINDGTALVIYAVAVGIVAGDGGYTPLSISGILALAYGGGLTAGLVVAWAGIWVRRRIQDPMLGNVATFVTPFAAFLLAEETGGSGVLAVVVVGLIMSQAGPRVTAALARRQSQAFWSFSTFMLNAALFVLIGIELHVAVRLLDGPQIAAGLLAVTVVCLVLVLVRIVFLFATTYLIRLIDRRPSQKLRRVSNRSRILSGMAGFRGAVSLAAALGVPTMTAAGAVFPNRGQIIFITAGVILVTLTVQGPLLPVLVRWAKLPEDTRLAEERRLAEVRAAEDGLSVLPELAARLGTDGRVVERLVHEYRHHLEVLRAGGEGAGEPAPALELWQQETELRLALLERKRTVVLALRDKRTIDDRVLRILETRLDVEELRLTQPDRDD
ncbi:Na+/H+ antiporter [Arthrobacter gandavensis]|uniref:Na+/H+ antiporter n=1 Tax=Arthrobacter gandavensis TaxID=169960 RepID=UPI00188DDCDA|nr:Na+/H+ antiporter [Arthrobacter gandavensis]MBF4995370.1 Na+/H+ antiporter [Arthrobacter gandavensis]